MRKIKWSLTAIILVATLIFSCRKKENAVPSNSEIYHFEESLPRWSSFENINGEKGQGGKENQGGKGHAYHNMINPHDTLTLLNIENEGVINRMWFTFRNRSKSTFRGLILNIYWDQSTKPAVSVPFGDFFAMTNGPRKSFENALFTNPEGRSFNSYIKMPFKKGARFELVNSLEFPIMMLFYDIDFELKKWHPNNLYFHAFWQRDTSTTLTEDFEILPKLKGKGRFLGSHVQVKAHKRYENTWWGEGELKIYLNNDDKWPTLVGTGTEDYIGTAWGQGEFIGRYQGCTVADTVLNLWSFYRYHIPDPIFFNHDIRVTLQQLGGAPVEKIREFQQQSIPLVPVAIIGGQAKQQNIYTPGKITDLNDPNVPQEGWCNFFRSDDVSAIAYFYLDRPTHELEPVQKTELRTHSLN